MRIRRVAEACEHSVFRPTYKAHSDDSDPKTIGHVLQGGGLLQKGACNNAGDVCKELQEVGSLEIPK